MIDFDKIENSKGYLVLNDDGAVLCECQTLHYLIVYHYLHI